MTIATGAVLWLMAVIGDAAHGVLMFPVLKPHSERLAIGYLAARILDASFIAIMVLFLLIQIPLGSEYLKTAAAGAPFLQSLSNSRGRLSHFLSIVTRSITTKPVIIGTHYKAIFVFASAPQYS